MLGDCNHQNFAMWPCSKGLIARNGEEYDKKVNFKRNSSLTMKVGSLSHEVINITREHMFGAHWFVQVGQPWICAGCDGLNSDGYGGYADVAHVKPPAPTDTWINTTGLNSKTDQGKKYAYSGSLSEVLSVTVINTLLVDISRKDYPLWIYEEKQYTVNLTARSSAPVGDDVTFTSSTDGADKTGRKQVYIGDLLSFNGATATVTIRSKTVLETSYGSLNLDVEKTEHKNSHGNLALGRPSRGYSFMCGVNVCNYSFPHYLNWEIEDGTDWYSPPWVREALFAADPDAKDNYELFFSFIPPADGNGRIHNVDIHRDNPYFTISPPITEGPYFSATVSETGDVLYSGVTPRDGIIVGGVFSKDKNKNLTLEELGLLLKHPVQDNEPIPFAGMNGLAPVGLL